MLSIKENLKEVMKGGSPDRYVKQYEFMHMLQTPLAAHNPGPRYGEENIVNGWGITRSWPLGTPGAFPVHTGDKIVVKDMECWQDFVHGPSLDWSEAEWEPFIKAAENAPADKYRTVTFAPGLFEQTHFLCEIQNTLMAFYEYPDELKDLVKYLTDFEVRYAETVCKHLHPEVIFRHDDWGSQKSTFMAPEMFEEFYMEGTKQIYDTYRENGVELVVHHSDSYAATLVEDMIHMGVDIWQGVMTTNDIPTLIDKYGEKITFMGGIDSALVDLEDWTPEGVDAVTKKACRDFGKRFFIPCTTVGGPNSVYPGVYEEIDKAIDEASREDF